MEYNFVKTKIAVDIISNNFMAHGLGVMSVNLRHADPHFKKDRELIKKYITEVNDILNEALTEIKLLEEQD